MTYLPDTRRQLIEAAERRTSGIRGPRLLPRARLGWVAPAVSLAVAAAVAVAFLGLGGGSPASRPAVAHRQAMFQVVFRAEPTPQVPVVTRAALQRTVREMHARLAQIPHSHASIRIITGHVIGVDLKVRPSQLGNAALARATVVRALTSSDQLELYDWESNVLLPNGRTAASGLSQNLPAAILLSQGAGNPSGAGAAGSAAIGAGALELYRAVRLASRQPYDPSPDNSRLGSEYYLFARAGSRACAVADRSLVAEFGSAAARSSHCLVAGPLDPGPRISRAHALSELYAGLVPADHRDGQVLVVKQGTVVLEAASPQFRVAEPFGDPNGGYYVLRDRAAVSGDEVINGQANTEPKTGAPDVQFGLTQRGAAAFQRLTAAEARRGELDSTVSHALYQHFAVALDNRLIIVPSIDYAQYPDGLTSGSDVHLTSVFTSSAARGVVNALRLGPLPVRLVPVR